MGVGDLEVVVSWSTLTFSQREAHRTQGATPTVLGHTPTPSLHGQGTVRT